jgi:hypothetical protein
MLNNLRNAPLLLLVLLAVVGVQVVIGVLLYRVQSWPLRYKDTTIATSNATSAAITTSSQKCECDGLPYAGLLLMLMAEILDKPLQVTAQALPLLLLRLPPKNMMARNMQVFYRTYSTPPL